MGDRPVQSGPEKVLLVPPPVRPRRKRTDPRRRHIVDEPERKLLPGPVEPWIETDAQARSPRRPEVEQPPPIHDPDRYSSQSDIPVPDITDEIPRPGLRVQAFEDPLTISHSNTVPLFGLAPDRVADPERRPQPVHEPKEPVWPWIVVGVMLAAGLALALALILL